MILDIYGFSKESKKLIEELLVCACEYTKQDHKIIECGVRMVGRDTIRRVNKEERNIDKVTDVLSFPQLEVKGKITKSKYLLDLTENDCIYLGDILVCKSKMMEQAKEFGHSNIREMCFLVLHGFLHLLGYDHINKKDEQKMLKAQREILEKLSITRDDNVTRDERQE